MKIIKIFIIKLLILILLSIINIFVVSITASLSLIELLNMGVSKEFSLLLAFLIGLIIQLFILYNYKIRVYLKQGVTNE